MKKQIFLFVAMLLPLVASAYDLSDSYGLYYNKKKDGTLEVVGLDKSKKRADILSDVTISGRTYQVTSIGVRAFEGRSDLTYLSIPWSVKSIGEYAFIDCGSRITVNIADPESWCEMELGNEHSSPLSSAGKVLVHDIETTRIDIPEGVTSIGNFTFYQCRCIKSLTIPSSVVFIGSSTFEDCTDLTSVTLNEGLESIGGSSFEGCTGLSSITIPSTVSEISINAFNRCTNLNNVTSLIKSPFPIDYSAFCTYDTATLTVPKGTKSVYQNTAGWRNFSRITDGTSSNEFSKSGINYIVTSSNTVAVKSIDSYLKSVDIPSSVSNGGSSYQVTALAERSFEGRSNVTYLVIPSTITSIGEYAFIDCGSNMEVNIKNLSAWCNVTLGNEHSSPLSSAKTLHVDGVAVKNLTIPNGVSSISNYAFYQCRCITSLTIPTSVTSIGSSTFEDCTGLTSLTLNEGLRSIGGSAFEGCTGLSAITIPSTVSEILINAFQRCSKLNKITSKIRSPFAIDSSTFSTYTTATLTVPYGTKSAYKSTSGWNRFSNIVEDDSGQPIIVTAKNYTREYGEENPSFGYTTSGADLKGTPAISCDATKTSPVGTYTIKISKGSVTNGNVTYVDGTLTITKALLTVTAKDCSREQGQVNPTFEVTYSGFKNNETESVLTKKPTASTTATTSSGPGQYVISVSGGEARNYDFKYVSGILTVTEKDEVVFTIDGTTYQGIKTDKTAIVKSVDKSMKSLEIPASVSYDGTTYQVTGIADNAFNGSNMAALIWNVETALPSNAFSNASIGSNFLLYVKSSSYAPSSVKNVVVDGTASSIVLNDDGGQFYCPKAFMAKSISYTHNYSMETGNNGKGWETLALPFDVQKISHRTHGEITPFAAYSSGSSQKPFWLANFVSNSFHRASAVKANEPYIIAMPNSSKYRSEYNLTGDVTFSSENVQVPVTPSFSGTFLPTFATVEKSSSVYALNVNNRYVKYSGNFDAGSRFISNLRDVRPFEAYISEGSTRGFFEINLADGTTDLERVILSTDGESEIVIHALNGQKVARSSQRDFNQLWNSLPKGVYIINGQKRIR